MNTATTTNTTTTTRRSPQWTKRVRTAILAAVARMNGRRRVRTLTEDDVDDAIALRRKSNANVVRSWGGFVSNSYNGSFGADCPVLRLNADGTWCVYLGSCNRAHGRGETLTENAS